MSFDVYLNCVGEGETAGISRQKLREIFGKTLTETEPNYWNVRYSDTERCNLLLTASVSDAGFVTGLSVNRPCSDPRFWDALYRVLTLGDVVVYFPGCHGPIVAHSRVIPHLPPDMVESLGPPVVVANGRELLQQIRRDD